MKSKARKKKKKYIDKLMSAMENEVFCEFKGKG